MEHRVGKEPIINTEVVTEETADKGRVDLRKTSQGGRARPNRFREVTPRTLTYNEPIVGFPHDEKRIEQTHVNPQQQGPSWDRVAPSRGRQNSFVRGRTSVDPPNPGNGRFMEEKFDGYSREEAWRRRDPYLSSDSRRNFERRSYLNNRDFRGQQGIGRTHNGWRHPMSRERRASLEITEPPRQTNPFNNGNGRVVRSPRITEFPNSGQHRPTPLSNSHQQQGPPPIYGSRQQELPLILRGRQQEGPPPTFENHHQLEPLLITENPQPQGGPEETEGISGLEGINVQALQKLIC